MAKPDDTPSMAVFCDFENVALGVRDAKYDKFDIRKVLERLLLKGSIVVKKAYCDWARYREFKAEMHEASFELIEIPHVRQSGKNSADIRLVVDALDLCYTKSHVDTFVIISGDSDFSPLVSKLRENAKTVIGVGVKGSTSDLLTANCDEFIFYDDLVREQRRRGARDAARREGPREAGRSETGRDANREVGREAGRDAARGAGGNSRGPRPTGEREPLRVVPGGPPAGTVHPDVSIGTLEPTEASEADRVGGPWRRQGSGATPAASDAAVADGSDEAGPPEPVDTAAGPSADAQAQATGPAASPAPRGRSRRSRARTATAAAAADAQADIATVRAGVPSPADAASVVSPPDAPVTDAADGAQPAEVVAPKKRAPRRRKAPAGEDAQASAFPATADATVAAPPTVTEAPSPAPEPMPEPEERPRQRSDEERRQQAIDLAIETVEALITERGADDKIWGSMVKQTLKRRRPGFAESYYGYRSFNELLEDARDRGLLALERDEKSGGYVIRLL